MIALAVLLIATPLLFNAGYAGLALRFGYPGILRRPTGEILERFRAGGTGLVLAPARDGDPVGRQAGGDVAFFLETDHFAGQHARMLRHGVRFREEPRHEPYGTVAVFEDLYGGAWDLIEPPAR